MQTRKGLWALIAAVVVCLGLLGYMFWGEPSDVTPGDVSQAALVDFNGADLHEEKDGQTIWSVKAERIQYNPKTRDFYLTNLKAEFHQGGQNLVITAKQASLTDNQQVFTIEGDVLGTGENLSFKGENLTYTSKDGKLHTDKPFYYKEGNMVLTGDTLSGDRVLRIVTAKGHVKLVKEN